MTKKHEFRSAIPNVPFRTLALCGAAICLTLGSAGLVASNIVSAPEAPGRMADLDTALPWRHDRVLAGTSETSRLRDELKSLRVEVQTARANLDQARAQDGVHAQDVRTLRAALESARSETASVKADLVARLDRADQTAANSGRLGERIDRLERRMADPVVTGSLAKPDIKPAVESPKPVVEAAKPVVEAAKPVQGYVLRDVYRGVALIETRRGMIEVAAGDMIPGAGRVQSVERHAGKWRVVTTNGFIDDLPE